MSSLELLLAGLQQAAAMQNLVAVMVGVLLGLAVGALPALGPSAGVAVLLPAIVNLEPTVAMAGLAGVYYGADRESVVKGKSVSVRVDLVGRRLLKKKKNK